MIKVKNFQFPESSILPLCVDVEPDYCSLLATCGMGRTSREHIFLAVVLKAHFSNNSSFFFIKFFDCRLTIHHYTFPTLSFETQVTSDNPERVSSLDQNFSGEIQVLN